MWIGILTPGAHESRPVAEPGVATLFCWNDIARIRVDGPADDLEGGLRMLRATVVGRGQVPHDPRCFACGCPYSIPDPEDARARAVDRSDLPDDPRDARDAVPPRPEDAPPLFALVHVDDEPGDDEEALVVVPSVLFAVLVPLEAVSRLLELLPVALADAPPTRCESCAALAPAGVRATAARPRSCATATPRPRGARRARRRRAA